jgi:hypothetical protein
MNAQLHSAAMCRCAAATSRGEYPSPARYFGSRTRRSAGRGVGPALRQARSASPRRSSPAAGGRRNEAAGGARGCASRRRSAARPRRFRRAAQRDLRCRPVPSPTRSPRARTPPRRRSPARRSRAVIDDREANLHPGAGSMLDRVRDRLPDDAEGGTPRPTPDHGWPRNHDLPSVPAPRSVKEIIVLDARFVNEDGASHGDAVRPTSPGARSGRLPHARRRGARPLVDARCRKKRRRMTHS